MPGSESKLLINIWKHLKGSQNEPVSIDNILIYLTAILNLSLPGVTLLNDFERQSIDCEELSQSKSIVRMDQLFWYRVDY